MSFSQTLRDATRARADELFEVPFVAAAVRGDLTLPQYLAFLGQAYHHVQHTVPLLMATGAALPPRHRWLQRALAEYIDEELGHEEWILDDIAACGGDAQAVRDGQPDRPCELLVAYAYDTVRRRNPLGFFGMVHVLEGTSVRGASRAAERLGERLGLPPSAFRYLSSHGELDVGHVGFFESLMDRVDDEHDQRFIVHCAHVFYDLYGAIFRALPAGASARSPLERIG